jgi:hypothetical protein
MYGPVWHHTRSGFLTSPQQLKLIKNLAVQRLSETVPIREQLYFRPVIPPCLNV